MRQLLQWCSDTRSLRAVTVACQSSGALHGEHGRCSAARSHGRCCSGAVVGAYRAGGSLLSNRNRLARGSGWRWWRAGEQALIVMDTGIGMEPGQLIDALGLGHSNKPPPGVTRGGSAQ